MQEGFERSAENSDVPIPFEEFQRGGKTNNFWLHFIPEFFGDAYRNQDHYKKFQQERPDLDKTLQAAYAYLKDEESLSLAPNSSDDDVEKFKQQGEHKTKVFEEHRKEFYEAYLIMRKYVKKDWQLFR